MALNFQKVIDKVPHNEIVFKIRQLGVDGNVRSWIENYIINRKSRVVIDGAASLWTLPKSSVLESILFIISINDIDVGLGSVIAIFVDETEIGNSITDKNDKFNLYDDLRKFSELSDR